MKFFTKILTESANTELNMTAQDFNEYKVAIEKTKRSKEFLKLLWLSEKYPELQNKEVVEYLIKGKNIIKTLDSTVAKDFIALAKKVGDEIRLLPQMLSASQRQAVIDGKINPDDLALDLETEKGRNNVAKKFIPLIEKIIKAYVDQSSLSKEELRSAAMVGLVKAMDEYKNPEELENANKNGNMSFMSYAAYRIKHWILKDMNNYSRNVKISKYYQNQLKDEDEDTNREFSIDHIHANDDDDKAMSIDRFLALADDTEDTSYDVDQELFKKLFKYLETKFALRDCLVFYKVNGLNDYKKEKSKDIAKELGVSAAAIATICTKIFKFIKNDKTAKRIFDAFESLADHYIQGKLFEVYTKDRQQIIESFLYDDIYLFLENERKWTKDKFTKTVNNAINQQCIQDSKYLYDLISGVKEINTKTIKSNKGTVEMFLDTMFPDRIFKNGDLNVLTDEMISLKEISDNFDIKW